MSLDAGEVPDAVQDAIASESRASFRRSRLRDQSARTDWEGIANAEDVDYRMPGTHRDGTQ